jgi:hypothetical protein
VTGAKQLKKKNHARALQPVLPKICNYYHAGGVWMCKQCETTFPFRAIYCGTGAGEAVMMIGAVSAWRC